MRIVLSADRELEGAAARAWCADHVGTDDEVIVVLGVGDVADVVLSMSPLQPLVEDDALLRALEHDYCEPLGTTGARCTARLHHGGHARAVLDVARREHADLVVVGKRPHGALGDALFDETATHVVHHPPCPVVVVPAVRDQAASGQTVRGQASTSNRTPWASGSAVE